MPPPPLVDPQELASHEIRRAETMAITGFVCGLVQFPAYMCCGLISLACAVAAWVLGHMAHAVLKPPEVQTSVRGLALAAKILGIVGVSLCVLGIVAYVLLLVGIFGSTWPGSPWAPTPPPTPSPVPPPTPPPGIP